VNQNNQKKKKKKNQPKTTQTQHTKTPKKRKGRESAHDMEDKVTLKNSPESIKKRGGRELNAKRTGIDKIRTDGRESQQHRKRMAALLSWISRREAIQTTTRSQQRLLRFEGQSKLSSRIAEGEGREKRRGMAKDAIRGQTTNSNSTDAKTQTT